VLHSVTSTQPSFDLGNQTK